MTNEQVAAVLDQMATMLELRDENKFKVNAYRNAARSVEQLGEDVADLAAAGKLASVRGLGESLRAQVATLIETGGLPQYDELRATLPPGLFDMMRVPGLGPKKVKALYDTLQVDTLEKLQAACEAGQVAKLPGFGLKTQAKILEGIAFLGQSTGRLRLDQVLPLAEAVVDRLRKVPGVKRYSICGSLRRRRETVKDMDLVFCVDDPTPLMDTFAGLPEVMSVTGKGDTKTSVVFAFTWASQKYVVPADLR